MIAWLVSLLSGSRRGRGEWRRFLVALLLLATVAAIVIITPPSRVAPRAERPPARLRSSGAPASAGRKRLRSPGPSAQLRRARQVGERFLVGYLPFAYGRARAGSVSAVTPGLRDQLMRERAQITPVEARRHPRVTSLQVIGKAAGVVLAPAMIEDGGIATYALRRLSAAPASGP
jgi:hypothetical protein